MTDEEIIASNRLLTFINTRSVNSIATTTEYGNTSGYGNGKSFMYLPDGNYPAACSQNIWQFEDSDGINRSTPVVAEFTSACIAALAQHNMTSTSSTISIELYMYTPEIKIDSG